MAGAAGAEDSPLLREVAVRQREFDDALGADDVHRALRSALSLGDLLLEQPSAPGDSDEIDRAHAALRSMMARLAGAGAEVEDRTEAPGSEVG